MLNENIKIIRKNKGFTQEELASRLHVTRQTISKWEKGLSVPDAEMLSRMAEVLDVSVAKLLGADKVEAQQMDSVVEQLCRINELLAIKNRRSRKIWRTIVIIAIIVVVVPMIITIASIGAFMVTAPKVQERDYDLGGTAKWVGNINGEEYNYYIAYDDDYKIHEYSGPDGMSDESDYTDNEHPDFSNYNDANEMAEDLEEYYNENGGELHVEIRQLSPEIYKQDHTD